MRGTAAQGRHASGTASGTASDILVARLRRLVGDVLDVRAADGLDGAGNGLDGAGDGRPLVVVDMDWDADLSRLPRAEGPVLPVYGLRGRVVIGPAMLPGRPGCPHCLALRVRAVDGQPRGVEVGPADLRRLSARRGGWGGWLPPGAERLTAAIVRGEAERLAGGGRARSAEAAFAVGSGGLSGDWHPVIAHAMCASPHCAGNRRPPPPPVPDLTGPLPATETGSSRRFPASRYAGRLEEEYLDSWSGIVRSPSVGDGTALPSVQVRVPTAWGFEEIAIGRAEDYATARPAAVLEGLERYAGWHCGGRAPAVFAAFADLDEAVDPRLLLLHPDEAYRTPGFPYTPFTPETPTGWAEAYSARTGRRTLVPFHVAYYGAAERPETGPRFVYENSNGCALGSGTEEALMAALLEVAERDAFLCAWYSQTPLPEIDLDALPDAAGRAVHAVRHRTGRDLRAFWAVGVFDVPVVLLVSTSDDPERPATLVTAGSALTRERALIGAAHEMAACAPAITAGYRPRRAELERALEDPDLVRRMEDHALAGALPGARRRFSFLLDEVFPEPPPVAALHEPVGDIAADLAAMLAAAERQGHEVLVVDHTTGELERLGLRCVKAIVPGTVPMTFGHRHRRPPPVETLNAFRARNGMSRYGLSSEEVRHEPHPFP
ncbi:bacteriocin biosynthesis protein SagD [Planomonospora sphaerica]|uniref:Bacteriocin biosynthesis protein SagD n=1 Tax=Planomonospora sphaerica TaxID=161355 RepID=A0A161MD05_9ACTN|nr:TOMM precursor leader peptide-binding protein [Planomonospora sphaerica]GAT69283.1 bacteriocin biosynthesis protein SagD [Planomonospora sphaerica]